ncbi:MAG: hypothetical protein PF795_15720 [Kiritimatiellae bacterium]|jgi:hypothetical protein|nr:hypothetical protein [Kiritimatiellia bacterium]
MSPILDFSGLKDFFRDSVPDYTLAREPIHRSKTPHTTTVFSGEPEEWISYLKTPWDQRRNHPLELDVEIDKATHTLKFHASNSDSKVWAKLLNEGIKLIRKHLESTPTALEVFEELIFENPTNFTSPLHIHATHPLPSLGTREVRFDTDLNPIETDIVLRALTLQSVEERMKAAGKKASDLQKLGILWPVLRRVVSKLGYSSYPRDRFRDRIVLTSKVSFVTIQLLFDGKEKGKLVPNEAGDLYMDFVSERENIKKKHLYLRSDYFRMLNDMSFLVKEKNFANLREVSEVVVRDYLDQQYLRISLAGVMPGMLEWTAPMDFTWVKKRKVETPSPQKGKYGILDQDDYNAWKKLYPHLKDIGFVLLRQLGMGQFGRVYEALNLKNSSIPEHVAIKVDRVRKGKKKEAIQAVDTIMDISRGLSQCPHVIRIYDAGKLKQIDSTYHILQLVDGDTLDNLIGVTGSEHASVYRPPILRTSVKDLKREYLRVIRSTEGEKWRRERMSLPFTDPLSLSQSLDVITSTLLWLEEVHGLNFAINDLKNGNLMISRNGQLKGIDLDTYSPVYTPLDKLPDFFFLAITMLMFMLRVITGGDDEHIKAGGLLSDPKALEQFLKSNWRFGDLTHLSHGRVHTEEVIHWFMNLINHSRDGSFAHEPEMFTACIDQLIHMKRGLVNEEMVLD